MKTKNITYIVISILLLSPVMLRTAGATENLEVIAIDNEKTVRMELTNPASAAINVTLFDETERIQYSDNIATGATFEDEFDFSKVRKGTYRLVSDQGNLRYNRIFQVKENAVEFQESYYSFIPQFKLDGDHLMVHFVNNLQQSLGISIEDEVGQIYSTYYDETGNTFSEVFAINRLEAGSYVMHMMTDGEMFSYAFNLE